MPRAVAVTRVLLLGAGGMLGRDLTAAAPPQVELTSCLHRQVDVTDPRSVEQAFAAARPEVVITAAAYTDVDGAETEREKAHAVNGVAPGIIGAVAARAGALVVHYSTDYVFTGTYGMPLREDDPLVPLNHYGASKLEGERALEASGARHVVIRTQWLFGFHGRSFPRTMWERARGRQPTRVVNDQFGRPTYTCDLARATWSLLDQAEGARLVVHVANTGIVTWYDLARRVFQAAGADDYLQSCTSAEFPRPARRPAWSALDTARYDALAGGALPSWEDALDRFLVELRDGKPESIGA